VLTTQGDRYAVAAIVVQESPDGTGTAQLAELATRLADEARRLLLEERPGASLTAAVAVSAPDPRPATVVSGEPAPAVAGIEVDRHAYRASVDGRGMELSFREFELLAFLVENPGRVFSRRQLVSSVWDGAEVGARTVDVHVRRLRMKLGTAADRIITVRNVGYRWEAARPDLAVA
jgi:DNA-binding response OmpR family regulator